MIFRKGKEVPLMKKYCDVCDKEVDYKIIKKKETYNVLGEAIEVTADVLVCAECGEELFSDELDNQTLLNAYNEYRIRHKLMKADEIREVRERYGLSQRSFARLLNWSDKTIRRYENGSIQDKVHNSLLMFLKEPENMRTYLRENEITLNEKELAKLNDIVDRLISNGEKTSEKQSFKLMFSNEPTIENGFKVFDYDKLCAMVLFFANKSNNLLKTKLLKLINYSDMLFYKENGISISGNKYVHLPYGPVMQNHDLLFYAMEVDHIAHIDIDFNMGYEMHHVVPEQEYTEGVLSEDELDILNKVYEKFKNFGSADISDYSHKEKGYMETVQGEIISYSFAQEIDLYRE